MVYREQTGKKTEIHTYHIEAADTGFHVILERRGPGVEMDDECQTDADFSTIAWKHVNRAEKTEMEAQRRGDKIELSGIHAGKSFHKTLTINGRPWKQLFSIDFVSFAAMAESNFSFWSIGTSGIGALKAAEFTVRRKETKTIRVNGRDEEAICLRIALKGMRSIFWHGDYWLRKADGRYLLYEGRNGLFAAMTRKELLTEE